MRVRLILCVNSEAAKRDEVIVKPVAVAEGREGGNSEVSKRNGVKGKLFAVAEGREGGSTTLDITKWDFKKANCRTRCRKLIEHSKPLLLIGSPIDSGVEDMEQTRAVLHLQLICEIHDVQVARPTVLSSHTFALRKEL